MEWRRIEIQRTHVPSTCVLSRQGSSLQHGWRASAESLQVKIARCDATRIRSAPTTRPKSSSRDSLRSGACRAVRCEPNSTDTRTGSLNGTSLNSATTFVTRERYAAGSAPMQLRRPRRPPTKRSVTLHPLAKTTNQPRPQPSRIEPLLCCRQTTAVSGHLL